MVPGLAVPRGFGYEPGERTERGTMKDKNREPNPGLVKAWITVIESLPEIHRRAIIGHFESIPRPPSLIGLGRAGSGLLTRAQLVDYCKRIEFCYKEWHNRNSDKIPFIAYSNTENLCSEIAELHGDKCLIDYVEHLEGCFERGSWGGFSRPERMKEHFQAWKEKNTVQT